MFRKLIITTTAALALSAAALPASANGINIEQFGFGNVTGGTQNGFNNLIGIFQDGHHNEGLSRQFGNGNTTAIGQTGAHNFADAWQNGFGNSAGIGQFGTDHNAVMTQDGNGNIAAGGQLQGDGQASGAAADDQDIMARGGHCLGNSGKRQAASVAITAQREMFFCRQGRGRRQRQGVCYNSRLT